VIEQRPNWSNDTAEINFTKHREIPGLGFLGKGQGYGFLLHSALMLSEDGQGAGTEAELPTAVREEEAEANTHTVVASAA